MRAHEFIAEYGDTKERRRQRTANFDYDTMDNAFYRKRGTDPHGWYSVGKTNPRDPHEFVKTTRLTSLMDQDAYYHYIKVIDNLRKTGHHNPFFPVVYSVDIVQDKNGKERPKYRIEQLQKDSQYDEEVLGALYQRLFKDRQDEYIDSPWYEISNELRDAVAHNDYRNIQDTDLIDALKIIRDILDDHPDWDNDLHRGNIMIRGSSTGPQLVISDPISDGGASIPSRY